MLKKSSHRKETDVDFEEKKLNLGLGEEDLDKENDYYTRPASPVLHGDVPPPYEIYKYVCDSSFNYVITILMFFKGLKNQKLKHITSTHRIHIRHRVKEGGHLVIPHRPIVTLLLLDTPILLTRAGDHIQNPSLGNVATESAIEKESSIITKPDMIDIITDQSLVKEIYMDLPANLSLHCLLLKTNDGQTRGTISC